MRSNYLSHAGKRGMRWGYTNGAPNGKRTAEEQLLEEQRAEIEFMESELKAKRAAANQLEAKIGADREWSEFVSSCRSFIDKGRAFYEKIKSGRFS